jgi:uncharacterized protein (TIGR00369 family)
MSDETSRSADTDKDAKAALDLSRPHGAFADMVGYHLVEWDEGRARVILDVEKRHLNRSGIMHGGVLTTLIDVASGYAGCYCAKPGHARWAVTLQLSCQFLGKVAAGDRLTAQGTVTGGGRSVYFARAEIRRQDGQMVGHGEGVFKYRSGSESPDGVPADRAPRAT